MGCIRLSPHAVQRAEQARELSVARCQLAPRVLQERLKVLLGSARHGHGGVTDAESDALPARLRRAEPSATQATQELGDVRG